MEVGNYELVRRLARGGMAEIFLARQKAVGGFRRNVVLKRILPECAEDPLFLSEFLNEARLSAQLSHPNIVQIFDFGEARGIYYLAMEYIQGFDLQHVLQRRPQGLPFAAVVGLIRDVATGLDYAHRASDADGTALGIIHRDVSPSNVLVSLDGMAKLVDFGVAKATAVASNRTATGQIKGKAAYLAPEQILGQALDRRVDVFALGTLTHELTTGINPFAADVEFESLTQVVEKEVPMMAGPLGPLVARALEKDPAARFQSCRELLAELDAIAVTEGVASSRAAIRELMAAEHSALQAQRDETFAAMARDDASESTDRIVARVQREAVPRRKTWPIIVGAAAIAALATVATLAFRSRPPLAPVALVATAIEPPPVSVPALTPPPQLTAPPPPRRAPTQAHSAAKPKAETGEGSVRLIVNPYGTLRIDGAEMGDIPRPADVLHAGPHVIEILNPDLGKHVTRKIVIVTGEEVIIRENLLEH